MKPTKSQDLRVGERMQLTGGGKDARWQNAPMSTFLTQQFAWTISGQFSCALVISGDTKCEVEDTSCEVIENLVSM